MNPVLKWTLIALPIIIGGYIILKKTGILGKRGKDKKSTDVTKDTDIKQQSGSVKPAVIEYFPLSRGSKGEKVKELQRAIMAYDPALLPKFKDDGDYGSETEAAVQKLLGKSSVNSQEDIAKIVNMKKSQQSVALAAEAKKNRITLANQLKSAFKPSYAVYAGNETEVFVGSYEPGTGREIETKKVIVKGGDKIIPSDFASGVVVESNGNMTFTLPPSKASNLVGALIGLLSKTPATKFVRVSPYAIYFK